MGDRHRDKIKRICIDTAHLAKDQDREVRAAAKDIYAAIDKINDRLRETGGH